MGYYPVVEPYVLYVTGPMHVCIAHYVNTGHRIEKDDDIESVPEYDLDEARSIAIGFLVGKGLATTHMLFSGRLTTLPNDDIEEQYWDIVDDRITYIMPRKKSLPFVPRPYPSVDALVEEYHNHLCQYLPDDFDYRECIYSVRGVYYQQKEESTC